MSGVKRKINVTIAGQELTLISDEPEINVFRAAQLADSEINSVREAAPALSGLTASLLAATNLADRYISAQETADSLRAQMKDYIEEVARTKNELADTRRELNRLKKEK